MVGGRGVYVGTTLVWIGLGVYVGGVAWPASASATAVLTALGMSKVGSGVGSELGEQEIPNKIATARTGARNVHFGSNII